MVSTDLPLPLFARGKVRDVYALDGALLIVATDRLSAFDHILPTPIPDKGRVLTQLSAFWFGRTRPILANHMITTDVAEMPPVVQAQAKVLTGRAMLVRRARRLDIECVARGYLAGSAWLDYRHTGVVCGVRLPAGLREGARLPVPIFTPATKASSGHDLNITIDEVAASIGAPLAARLRDVTLALYEHARAYAGTRGLVLADTKFEFGLVAGGADRPTDGSAGDRLVLIDEALTPDSSRYWDAAAYARGELVAFDKQYVRDFLMQIGWNREPPPPALPPDVVAATRGRYLETFRRLTGRGGV
jgi:phosphoribosylaminoimidazole-succinocarboxamide synthase